MLRIFRSPPVAMGARSALGFGLGFAAVVIAAWQISFWLFTTLDPWINRWSVWYYDTFRTERGIFLFQDLLQLITTILTGLVFGVVFGLLFGHRSRYMSYMLVGTLGFMVSGNVSFVVSEIFGWSPTLSPSQGYILNISMIVLIGTVWGAICALLDNSHKTLLRFLATSALLYPLGMYIFMRLLLTFGLKDTPWSFVSLLTFLLILICEVFAVVIRNDRKIPWMVIAAAIGYPILFYGIFYFAYDILHMPRPEPGVGISPEALVVYQLNYMVVEASIGAIFGLLIGLIWGYQRKNDSRQVVT